MRVAFIGPVGSGKSTQAQRLSWTMTFYNRCLAEAIPNAKLRLLEDAGHLVFVERFADVNREVVRFLKSSEAQARRTGGGVAEEAPREAEGWLRRSMRAVRGWVARMKAAMRAF
jgi:shikimate kinase